MPPQRLSAAELRDHLLLESPSTQRIVRVLRRRILDIAPQASEAVRFHVLSYYRAEAAFGSIGGNIGMIEVKAGRVTLSFIHGVELRDPHHLLQGRGKYKRFVPIKDRRAGEDPRLLDLIRSAAAHAGDLVE